MCSGDKVADRGRSGKGVAGRGKCYYENDVHYIAKSRWTPARQTSHSKILAINMELVPLLL
jgi:hypothetical protein